MYKLMTILLTAAFLVSCDSMQNEMTKAFTPEIDEPEFYFQGIVSDGNGQMPFDLFIGPANSGPEGQRFFLGSTLSSGNNGPTLLVGAYNANINAPVRIEPRIELQFWPDNVGEDQVWQADEVRAFFAAGNQYELGGEVSTNFHFSLLLPLNGNTPDIETSQSRFLDSPNGLLTITATEDYNFTDIGAEMVPRMGLLVRCTFNADVGRYDVEADQADGMPSFSTDEVVEFTAGEAVIFVPFEEKL
jgi:hypothetical protein